MGTGERLSHGRFLEALQLLREREIPVVRLGEALGKGNRSSATMADWEHRPPARFGVRREDFERALAEVLGEAAPRRVVDPFSYAMGSFVGIEADVQHILGHGERILTRIREVRETVGLIPASQRSFGDANALRSDEGRAAHREPGRTERPRKAPKKRKASGGRSA